MYKFVIFHSYVKYCQITVPEGTSTQILVCQNFLNPKPFVTVRFHSPLGIPADSLNMTTGWCHVVPTIY